MDDVAAADRIQRAIVHLQSDELAEAEPLLQQVLDARPHDPDALHFLGLLRHAQKRGDEALALLRLAAQAAPQASGVWNNLGNLLLAGGHVDEAVEAYERAVGLLGDDPAAAATLTNLAILRRTQDRHAQAEAACRQALAIDDQQATAWYILSRVLIEGGRVHDGLMANSRAIRLVGGLQHDRHQVVYALLNLGERDEAAKLYREWLAEEPDNELVRHQLAACLGEAAPERASDHYVETLFDAFAGSFDAKLEQLGYRAPGLVAQALQRALEPSGPSLDICDAGCGTGLCGPLVKPWSRRLVGCDLSVGMLRKASARQVYDALHRAELIYYLDTQPGHFDAVLAADVLCYFGSLDAVFQAAGRALRPRGALVFSVEALHNADPADHRLMTTGRYAHRLGYLCRTLEAAGFEGLHYQREDLRLEAGLGVGGWVLTARRKAG